MLPSFEPQVVSPEVIGIIYGVGLGLILIGLIVNLIYQYKYGVQLDKDDPLLSEQKELKKFDKEDKKRISNKQVLVLKKAKSLMKNYGARQGNWKKWNKKSKRN